MATSKFIMNLTIKRSSPNEWREYREIDQRQIYVCFLIESGERASFSSYL